MADSTELDREEKIQGLVMFIIVVTLGFAGAILSKERNITWLRSLGDGGELGGFILLCMFIYISPMYLALKGIHWATRRFLAKKEGWVKNVRIGVDDANRWVSLIPQAFGAALAKILRDSAQGLESPLGKEHVLVKALQFAGNVERMGALFGVVLFFSVEFGWMGYWARRVLLAGVLLYIPVGLWIVAQRTLQPKKRN